MLKIQTQTLPQQFKDMHGSVNIVNECAIIE